MTSNEDWQQMQERFLCSPLMHTSLIDSELVPARIACGPYVPSLHETTSYYMLHQFALAGWIVACAAE
jgi:hypothetical protein